MRPPGVWAKAEGTVFSPTCSRTHAQAACLDVSSLRLLPPC